VRIRAIAAGPKVDHELYRYLLGKSASYIHPCVHAVDLEMYIVGSSSFESKKENQTHLQATAPFLPVAHKTDSQPLRTDYYPFADPAIKQNNSKCFPHPPHSSLKIFWVLTNRTLIRHKPISSSTHITEPVTAWNVTLYAHSFSINLKGY
jgi:hypothetical protein